MRIGIFGGTFDPPHIAHLILPSEAQYQLCLDHLLFVLTPIPPHKQNQPITPVQYRINLLQAVITGSSTFEFSRVDIDRKPPYYAVDTMRILKRQYPDDELIYLMGGDSLMDIPTWHSPVEFVNACHAVGVFRRPNDQIDLLKIEKNIPGISMKIRFIKAPLLEISSSDIRQRIVESQPYEYLLPPEAYQIIKRKNLYREG